MQNSNYYKGQILKQTITSSVFNTVRSEGCVTSFNTGKTEEEVFYYEVLSIRKGKFGFRLKVKDLEHGYTPVLVMNEEGKKRFSEVEVPKF